jgi:hypothetical protein
LDAALFSYDHSRKSWRYELVAALAPEVGASHPRLWIRATRKHTIEISDGDI